MRIREIGHWGHKGISNRVIGVYEEGLFTEMRYLEVRKNLRDEVLEGSQGFRDMASLKGYVEKREAGLLGTGSRR